MDQAAAERKWNTLHEKAPWHDGTFEDWAPDRSDSHPFHMNDGVQIWVDKTDWNPDDHFLG